MKKIFITFLALAAITGTAYARDGSDLRDSDTYFGKYSTQLKNKFNKSTSTEVVPLAIGENETGLTNFERMMRLSRESHQSNRH